MSHPPSGSPHTSTSHGPPSLAFPREQAGSSLAEYDALADLFLGEGGPALASTRPGVPEAVVKPPVGAAVASSPTAHATAAPALKLAGEQSSPPRAAPPPRPSHGPSNQRPPSHPTRRPDGFEAIALGHLPVMASAWAMQYVRSVAAERQQPVAVLRVGAGRVSLELVGEASIASAESFEKLAEASRAAARLTDLWLLRVDEPNETLLGEIEGVRAITLLTGADEVAVASCYRAIKGYLDLGLIARDDDEGAGLTLRLAIMGATPERAADAAGRIRRAASTYLGCSVQSVICAPKIAPSTARTLFRQDSEQPIKDVVAAVIAAWDAPETTAAPAETAAPVNIAAPSITPMIVIAPPASAAAAPDALDDLITAAEFAQRVAPSAPERLIPERLIEQAPAPEQPGVQPAERPTDRQADRPTERPADRPTERPSERLIEPAGSHSRIGPRAGIENSPAPLCSHIPGLTPLNIRCPFAPGAELACGSDGTLHILGHAGSDMPRVIELLVAAASWADVHAEILRQIRPSLRAGQTRTVLHVMTERPKEVRPLIDSDIRLHALVRGPSGVMGLADLN